MSNSDAMALTRVFFCAYHEMRALDLRRARSETPTLIVYDELSEFSEENWAAVKEEIDQRMKNPNA